MSDNNSDKNKPQILIAASGASARVYMPLAKEIGMNTSILLLQLDYWINHDSAKTSLVEGEWWIELGAREISRLLSEALSPSAVSSQIKKLEKLKLIKVKRDGERLKIALDVAGLRSLKSIAVLCGISTGVQNPHTTESNESFKDDKDDKRESNEGNADRTVRLEKNDKPMFQADEFQKLTAEIKERYEAKWTWNDDVTQIISATFTEFGEQPDFLRALPAVIELTPKDRPKLTAAIYLRGVLRGWNEKNGGQIPIQVRAKLEDMRHPSQPQQQADLSKAEDAPPAKPRWEPVDASKIDPSKVTYRPAHWGKPLGAGR